MTQFIAFIVGLCKASQAMDALAGKFVEIYSAWKKDQNLKAQDEKNAANDAAVDAAVGRVPDTGSIPDPRYAYERDGDHSGRPPIRKDGSSSA